MKKTNLNIPEELKSHFDEALNTKSLDLSNGNITDNLVKSVIVPFLNANPSISTLNVNSNYISPLGAKKIAKITTLKTLYIAENPIGYGVEALAKNATLITLDVSSNKLNFENIEKLMRNTTLKNLNVSSNPTSRSAALFLLNTTLKSLNISNCQVDDSVIAMLVFNEKLTTLDVSGNNVSENCKKDIQDWNRSGETTFMEQKMLLLLGMNHAKQTTEPQTLPESNLLVFSNKTKEGKTVIQRDVVNKIFSYLKPHVCEVKY